MNITKLAGLAVASAMLASAFGGATQAAPLAGAKSQSDTSNTVQQVRHGWRGGGVGIYIGPSYGGYYDDDYYYPRYRRAYSSYGYYDSDYSYRSYHRHSRKWARERFRHPLGRR